LAKKLIPAKPRSNASIEKNTLEIITKFQSDVLSNNEPFDIECFFDCDLEEFTGVKTDYQKLPFGIHGYTDSELMLSVISRDLAESESQNFFTYSTIAHEVGHAFLHVKDYRKKQATLLSLHEKDHNMRLCREEEIPLYMNPEWQAWSFAGAILMPATEVQKSLTKGYNISDLSERFRVNPAFVKSRLRKLKLRAK
jgi:Zn-dependent peptidase ImmA (M78 family)